MKRKAIERLPLQSEVRELAPVRTGVPSTNERYNGHIRQFNRWNGGELVSAERIAEYIAAQRGILSASTLRGRKAALKRAVRATFSNLAHFPVWRARLDAAFEEMRVPASPAAGVSSEDLLTKAEVTRLGAAMPVKLRLMLHALFASGFRISELLSIRVRDCRRPPAGDRRGRVRIRVIGKGSKERKIPAFKVDLYNSIVRTFKPSGANDFLFRNHNPRSKAGNFSRQYVWREFNRYALETLGRPLHPHLLRHSFATTVLENGAQISAVGEHLGHSDPSITAKYYSHVSLRSRELASVDV